MASLRNILASRAASSEIADANLEKGKVYTFNAGHMYNSHPYGYRWQVPGEGLAVIEIWGGTGASALGCCCSQGIPGNPGAYVKKCAFFGPNGYVCIGEIGYSCGNADAVCYRGRSSPTTVIICSGEEACCDQFACTCLCAQGGFGGALWCTHSACDICCFMINGYCHTIFCTAPNTLSAACGIICNFAGNQGVTQAFAFGTGCRLTLKDGGISCATFTSGDPANDHCKVLYHVKTNPGIISEEGVHMTFANDRLNSNTNTASGHAFTPIPNLLGIAGKDPSAGNTYQQGYCAAWHNCGCYQVNGCVNWLPMGVPAPGPLVCSTGSRDHGYRGGPGGVRIKWLGNN